MLCIRNTYNHKIRNTLKLKKKKKRKPKKKFVTEPSPRQLGKPNRVQRANPRILKLNQIRNQIKANLKSKDRASNALVPQSNASGSSQLPIAEVTENRSVTSLVARSSSEIGPV